ncbi:MAG: ParB/RepB/Spo0J family partition protein [Prevotellaceae bacterium]|jgi:ParB family chromosome partitioning protein|nr:ParB/RepB/Spo0J family partition protein [Prevotellaceae bacterium]
MAKEAPKKLGRGLDSLLGGQLVKPGLVNEQQAASTQQVVVKSELVKEIPLSEIEPNPGQPRTNFDEERLVELSESIKALGIIQPITVRVLGANRYQIISGERRWRASRMAGLERVPAYIRTVDDNERLILALVENIQREDLDPVEEALSYQRLINEAHLTQEEISGQVGKKRSTVANSLRLLRLPDEIQLAIRERLISAGHARQLVNIDSVELQRSLAKKIVEEGLSVRQVEELVKSLGKPKAGKEKSAANEASEELSDSFVKLVEGMEKCFNGAVSVKRGLTGGAKLTIELKTDNDIKSAIEKLGRMV